MAAIVAEDAFEYLDAPVRRVAAIDTPIPFAPPLEREYMPLEDDIVRGGARARRLLRNAGRKIPLSACGSLQTERYDRVVRSPGRGLRNDAWGQIVCVFVTSCPSS